MSLRPASAASRSKLKLTTYDVHDAEHDSFASRLTTRLSARPCPRPSISSDLVAAGDDVHHTLLVLDITTVAGDHPRTTLLFGNRTGRIQSAPFWAGRDEMIRGLIKGIDRGRWSARCSSPTATACSSMQPRCACCPRVRWNCRSKMVPSAGPVDRYWQRIDEVREKISAPRLRAVLDLFYRRRIVSRAVRAVSRRPRHRASRACWAGCCSAHARGARNRAADREGRAGEDAELVAAGVLLHDIGKLDCYSWGNQGRLRNHGARPPDRPRGAQGVIMLNLAVSRAPEPPCTARELMLLERFILSHHGKLEYGGCRSSRSRSRRKFCIFADDASAKDKASINEAYGLRENFPDGEGVSAKKIWQFDGRWMFKAESNVWIS